MSSNEPFLLRRTIVPSDESLHPEMNHCTLKRTIEPLDEPLHPQRNHCSLKRTIAPSNEPLNPQTNRTLRGTTAPSEEPLHSQTNHCTLRGTIAPSNEPLHPETNHCTMKRVREVFYTTNISSETQQAMQLHGYSKVWTDAGYSEEDGPHPKQHAGWKRDFMKLMSQQRFSHSCFYCPQCPNPKSPISNPRKLRPSAISSFLRYNCGDYYSRFVFSAIA